MRTGKFSKGQVVGAGCLVLFSLPFLGVALGAFFLMGRDVVDYVVVQDWAERPAKILSAKLEEHHDDGSTSYRAVVSYAYDYEGTTYTGDRIVRHAFGSDNVGPFQKDWAARLKVLAKHGETIPCYVNPGKPAEAVLYRGLRWEMLLFKAVFAIGFGVGGCFPFLMGLASVRQRRDHERAPPDQPWLGYRVWQGESIRSDAVLSFLVIGVMALLWNVISVPIFVFLLMDSPHFLMVCLVGIFPLVGALLAIFALVQFFRWGRFRHARLHLQEMPVQPGGWLRGELRVPAELPPRCVVTVKLDCVVLADRKYAEEEVIWTATRRLATEELERYGRNLVIPVGFELPEAAKESTADSGTGTTWRLLARAEGIPGPDMHLEFPVPVYRTEEVVTRSLVSDPSALDELAEVPPPGDFDVESALIRQDIQVFEPVPGSTRIVVAPFRAVPMHLILLVFISLFLVGSLFLAQSFWYLGYPAATGFLWLLTWALRSLLRQQTLQVDEAGITVVDRCFGIERTRHYGWGEIRSIGPVNAGSTQTGSVRKTWYHVRLQTRQGKGDDLLRWLVGESEAKYFVDLLSARLPAD